MKNSLVFISLFVTACGSEAKLWVTAPAYDATVKRSADGTVAFEVHTLGVRIAEPGSCGKALNCGHIAISLSTIDTEDKNSFWGHDCLPPGASITDIGAPIAIGVGPTIKTDLALCPRQTGRFNADVWIADDNGKMIESTLGNHTASVRFSVR